jgi:hypothetical protein
MQLFGIEIIRKKKEIPTSVISPLNNDGSTEVSSATSGYYAQVMELEAHIKNENDLIRRYREIAQYSDTDSAIEDICNEAIISEEDKAPIEINLDDLKVSAGIKTKITDEFKNVLNLLDFNNKGHDIFKSWYIDGRIYFHVLVDENAPNEGILELRPIDPRKIRKIRNIKKDKLKAGVEIIKDIEEYYLYNDKGITETSMQGVKLPLDAVIYTPSGLVDANTSMTLSNLHKAIKLVNQLKMMEDAIVIYRISRAPERRIFYVDVGNLPKIKAEQYVNDLMNKFRNKVVYDATTGEIKDSKKHLSMMEDFWMPRREGGKGTEITTLPGGQNLSSIDDIKFFQDKLYQALRVPISRIKGESGFNIGRSSEITRDEIKFNKFVQRIRKKFSMLFLDTLRMQLILKGIINPDDWDNIKQFIRFDFMRDNYYAEVKENEILNGRLATLQVVDPYVGKYYSVEWVRKNILQQTDEDIKEIDSQKLNDREHQLDDANHAGNVQIAQQEPVANFQDERNLQNKEPT